MTCPIRTLLIVEDFLPDRERYQHYLAADPSCTYRFIEAESAIAGLEVCRTQTVDAILLKDGLPDATGLEFLQALNAQRVGEVPPVVIVADEIADDEGDEAKSAAVTMQRVVQAIKLGAEDYLNKRYLTSERLQAAVQNAIENNQNNRLQNPQQIEIQRLNRELDRRLEELQTILDAVPVGIAIADDPTCQVIQVNGFAQEMLAVPLDANMSASGEQAQTLPFRQLRNGQDIPPEELPMQQAVAQGTAVRDAEIEVVRSDGARFDWRVNAVPLFDEAGAVRGCVAAFTDITDVKRRELEQKQSENRLRQQEEQLRLFVKHTPAGVAMFDCEMQYILVSDRWLTSYGLENQDLTGRSHYDIFPEISERWKAIHQRCLAGAVEACEEDPFPRTDGSVDWVRWEIHPWRTSTGEIGGIIAFSEVITERRQAEIALQEQTKLLQQIVESIGDGLIWVNLRGEIVLFNQAAEQIFGALTNERSCEEWSSTYGLFLPDQQALFPDQDLPLARAMRGEVASDVEVFVQRDRASAGRWISISGYPVLDRDNGITGGVITCRDVTERKRTESELSQTLQKLNFHIENSPLAVVEWDHDFRVSRWSSAAERVFGWRAEDLTGRSFGDWQFVFEEDLERVQHLAQRLAQGIEQRNVIYNRNYTQSGEVVDCEWYNSTLVDASGRLISVLSLVLDVSDRVRLEQERDRSLKHEQAAREAAERANRLKDEFLAVLSHELRSPLNPILGWTKLLRAGKLNPLKTSEALATIERNAKLQSQLIEDLLDISRIMRGKLVLNPVPVNLPLVILAAIDTVRLSAEAKSIAITTHLEPNVRKVSGDAGRLQQVVWNLLSNAVKFTPTAGRIEVRLTPMNNHIQLQVIDTGKGVVSEFLPHVFEHFRQEDGATTRKFGGLGLGLAIARQIVELHGGRIWVESAGENQGASFTVELPTLQAVNLIEAEVYKPILIPAETLPLANLRVLIVDDEIDSRDFVAFVVEEAGAEVIQVSSAIAALQTLATNALDILLSDIGMPEMDGYTLIRQVRESSGERNQHIPAVALTAYAGETDQQQAMEAGFQHHLAKPVEAAEIVTVIAYLCGR